MVWLIWVGLVSTPNYDPWRPKVSMSFNLLPGANFPRGPPTIGISDSQVTSAAWETSTPLSTARRPSTARQHNGNGMGLTPWLGTVLRVPCSTLASSSPVHQSGQLVLAGRAGPDPHPGAPLAAPRNVECDLVLPDPRPLGPFPISHFPSLRRPSPSVSPRPLI